MSRITREQAIETVGLDQVTAAEEGRYDFTNRLTDGTKWQGYVEFASRSDEVTAYVYFTREELDAAEELDQLSWPETADEYLIEWAGEDDPEDK